MLGAKEGSQPDASSHLGNQHPPTIQRKYSEPLPGHNPMVLKVSTGTGLYRDRTARGKSDTVY